ncbi:MAG: P-II family nitrogen regulator [Solidesulfovibrio sp.]
MKEVIAIIRVNMMNKTKDALLASGVPAFFASEVLGRGKGLWARQAQGGNGPLEVTLRVTENKMETGRLFAKRMLTVVVPDDKVESVVSTIIAANQTQSPGDGKIFVLDMDDSVRVRTGEYGNCAIN